MHKHTKILFGLLCIGVAVGFMEVPSALAATQTYESYLPSETSLRTGTFISQILDAINVLAWIAFDLIDQLLNPDFIFNNFKAGPGGSQIYTMLNKIWVLSRNLMNILFAVVLVIAAIYTTIKADMSLVKESMGRFVLAVVLVNFSWLFPLMVLDLANVMTSFVYGLPNEIPSTTASCEVPDTKTGGTKKCKIVTGVLYFPAPARVAGETCDRKKLESREQAEKDCGYTCHFGLVCYKLEDWSTATPGYKSVINGLVFNYGRLGDIARIPSTAAPTASASNIQLWVMFIIRQLISIVMMVALAFPLMALALAFLMRIPVLWVTIAFMPFFFAGWVLEGKIPGAEKTKGILDEFIKAAFLPVITALPLTIGFIMMNALATTGWNSLADQLSGRAPVAGTLTTFFDILWMCLALGIMWKGTFMALESGGMAGQFGGWFKGMGEAIGKIAVLAPLQLPVIPSGVKGKPGLGIWGAAQQLNPKKWATALQYGSSFSDAMGKTKESTKLHPGIERNRSDIQRHAADAVTNKGDNTAANRSLDEIKRILKEELSIDINDKDRVVKELENLHTQGLITPEQLEVMRNLARTGTATPPAPPAAPAAGS